MFKFENLEKVQIEITNRCQASCPMCLRNIHGGVENPNLVNSDWTLQDFKDIFTPAILKQLKRIDFCGDFGEPTINNNLIDMCAYIKQHNPNIYTAIFTNGSTRTPEWWGNLAQAITQNHKIEFALDGLSDTHSLYRIGTDFNKILDNAKSFIRNGGYAIWMFIRFKHNQHQVMAAEALAKEHKFKEFIVKNSKRFGDTFPVINKEGSITHYLDQPDTTPIKFFNKEDLLSYQTWPEAETVNCFVLHDKEIYIDANFTVLPCCLLGSFLYANYDESLYKKYNVYDHSSIVDIGKIAQHETFRIVDELGGLPALNAKTGLENIVNNPTWQTIWQREWTNKTSPACIVLCGKNTPLTRVEDQVER
jgi:MoaA/NifB/PqqE/SkfB family radical SAM enzyme